MRKEVGIIRKRIDAVNKELRPLGQSCQKKVEFYHCLHLIVVVVVF